MSPTAEILRIYFLQTIVPRKYMRKISAVGLFCSDKFEETPNQKVIDLSKFLKIYFSKYPIILKIFEINKIMLLYSKTLITS